MKKLLLTSAAFTNDEIKNAFKELVAKPTDELNIIFIPTASRTPEELKYVQESKQELLELGVNPEHIQVFQLDHPVTYDDLKNADVVYVCGGNTYYILQKVREFGFDKALKQFIESGKVYFGVSAGSIIVAPSIDIAGIGETGDENDVQLKDTTGLHIVPFVVSPHYVESEKEILYCGIARLQQQSGFFSI